MSEHEMPILQLMMSAFHQAPFGVGIIDLAGLHVAVNERYAALVGRTEAELLRAPITDTVRPADLEWLSVYFRDLVTGQLDSYSTERVAVLADGTERTLQSTAWPVKIDGRCQGIMITVEPVPPRAGLADGRVRKLIENIDNTISLIDENGSLLETSGRYRPVLGYPSEFWETRTIFDLLHPDDAARVLSLRSTVLADPGHLVEEEVRVKGADGRYEPVHVAAINLLNDPDVGGIVITSRNVAKERDLMNALAERTERAESEASLRSRLIATVSHELRNPLHALNGLSELLTMHDLPPTVATLATTMHRQVAALTNVLDDLLDTARIDASGVELKSTTVELRSLADDIVSLVSSSAASRPVSVRAEISNQVPVAVRTDGSRLRQILTNLMGNAAKFTDRGTVELRIDITPDERLRFQVNDTGRGIAAEELESIFEPFTSARTAGNDVGAGLGLTIVRQVVAAMDGTISVSSKVSVGSTFEVVLPLEPASAVTENSPSVVEFDSGATVLVVEDNHVNQLLARNQLQRLGIRCEVVESGEEALRVLAQPLAPRIVLMDFQLPGIDGLETTRRIRAAEGEQRRAVIIGVTASAMAADREACTAAGMDDFMAKPVGLAQLSEMLQHWIEAPDDDGAHADGTHDDRSIGTRLPALDQLVEELGDVGIVHDLVHTYLRELEHRRVGLEVALTTNDREAVRKSAHALKSSSFLLGLTELGAICQSLEHDAADDDATMPTPDFDALAQSASSALEAWMKVHPAGLG